jgi:hypothetical protein
MPTYWTDLPASNECLALGMMTAATSGVDLVGAVKVITAANAALGKDKGNLYIESPVGVCMQLKSKRNFKERLDPAVVDAYSKGQTDLFKEGLIMTVLFDPVACKEFVDKMNGVLTDVETKLYNYPHPEAKKALKKAFVPWTGTNYKDWPTLSLKMSTPRPATTGAQSMPALPGTKVFLRNAENVYKEVPWSMLLNSGTPGNVIFYYSAINILPKAHTQKHNCPVVNASEIYLSSPPREYAGRIPGSRGIIEYDNGVLNGTITPFAHTDSVEDHDMDASADPLGGKPSEGPPSLADMTRLMSVTNTTTYYPPSTDDGILAAARLANSALPAPIPPPMPAPYAIPPPGTVVPPPYYVSKV